MHKAKLRRSRRLSRRRSRLAGLAIGLVSLVVPSKAKAQKRKRIAREKRKQLAALMYARERITTNGQGLVVAAPDATRVELGVEVQAKTAELARNQLARRMESVSRAIGTVGEKGLVMQTSQLDLQPIYSEAKGDRPAHLLGYRARNTLSLTLKNVTPSELGARAARLVDAGVSGGANVVSDISFFLSHPEEAQAKALKLAALDAQKNAQTLASALGLRIDRLHSMDGSPGRGGPLVALTRAAKIAAPTTIEPGEITISANVTAQFHFSKA
jgi:hypothetical protein